jgi:hypothetical protein
MKRRLFDRLRGGEQGGGESKDFQKFHQMVTDVNRDESRKLPHPQGGFHAVPGCCRRSTQVLKNNR